jgi:hypothetical protein
MGHFGECAFGHIWPWNERIVIERKTTPEQLRELARRFVAVIRSVRRRRRAFRDRRTRG